MDDPFHLENAQLTLIEHADAMVAKVYLVKLESGQELILKYSERPKDYQRESYFLKRLQGVIPVPRVLQEDYSHALLMEKLPGHLMSHADFTKSVAFELGTILATLHQIKMELFGDPTEEDTLSSDPFIPFTAKFEEGLAECSGHLPPELLKKCKDHFHKLIEQHHQVDGPCLIHRDFRPGNIFVHQGRIQGIIDWASSRSGFAEEDFCALEENQLCNTSFLEGYASIRPVPDYQKILPLLKLSKAIASIGFTVKIGTWNSRDAAFYQKHLNYCNKLNT